MSVRAKLGKDGLLTLPDEVRRALDLEEGDDLVLRVEGDTLRIISQRAALKRAREILKRHVPEGMSLADSLIQDRRAGKQ